jgi:hypothetical protein
MPGFRTTKYDPNLRSPNGAYGSEEWISVTDVGRVFLDHIFELSDYLTVEEAYVETVRRFLDQAKIRSLRVTGLESHGNWERLPEALVKETREHLGLAEDGREVCGDDLEWVVRLVLREAMWCRLEGTDGFYVHFGYDYYMYIGYTNMDLRPPLAPPGIFIEPFESPHHGEELEEEDDQENGPPYLLEEQAMTMRMSSKLRDRWQEEKMDNALMVTMLQPRLRAIIEAPLVRRHGGLLLEGVVANAGWPEDSQDITGYEASNNKIHIADFIDSPCDMNAEHLREWIQQSAKAAVVLSERLQKMGRYRVVLSLDLGTEFPNITLRFFGLRGGVPWGPDDPDELQLEEVLMIDTNTSS